MRRTRLTGRALVRLASLQAASGTANGQTPAQQPPRPAMTLTTPAWPDGDPIPVKYTQGTADAFEMRAAVMKAMQGHILGKAVYVGLFRRPQ